MISKEPTYNLKVVLRETGIKPDTLRAWERRYGLPQPERTAGGHRLYSQYDIEIIKWLIARQAEGLRINQAVKLWRNLNDSGEDPLADLAQTTALELYAGSTLDEMRQRWIEACLAYNEPVAENILAQAFARYPLETVCLEVLRKGLSEIGALWYQGETSVQQEHFASALAIRRLNALIAAAPAPSRNGKILIACPPKENHTFSALLVTLFLRQRGWDVVYLGANVPVERLNETVQSTRPNLVILTAMQLHTAAELYEMSLNLQLQDVPVAYGGLIFSLLPELRERIPAAFLGEALEDVVQAVENLLAQPQKAPKVEPIGDEYSLALQHFEERLPLVEAYLWQKIQTNGLKEYHLSIANETLARDINASLRLGDLNFIHSELDWVRALLENYHVPNEALLQYFAYYKEALEANMDEGAQPIINWMENILESETE